MANRRRSMEECRRILAAYEKAGNNQQRAAALLKMSRSTYQHALMDAQQRIANGETEDKDDIEALRERNRAAIQRRRIDELERQEAANRTIRESVFKLSERPLEPPSWNAQPSKGGKLRESIILFLSDIHMGEVVSLSAMGGRNSYNMKIAGARLERYFQAVVKLGTEHWTGPPPDSIYLVLGGDLVSGEIHEELAKTNDLQAVPAVRMLAEALAAGLQLLRQSFPAIPINVISVPGNHGRVTRKPESKEFAVNSYDTLAAWLLEWWAITNKMKGVTFSAPHSGDAMVTIHGWNVLFTHGDRIGSRGGSGFVGPAATAARGMQKVVQDYLAEGKVIDVIVMGHFHTPLELEYGFVNPSLVGPSEYSKSGRMRSHPAAQWMLSIHPTHGVARRWKIQVGDRSEGSIYGGKSA
jgi:predicted phosphodiesterase